MRTRLRAALRMERAGHACHQVHHAANWEEMHRFASAGLSEVAVFDPHTSGGLDLGSCSAFAAAYPSVRMLAYGDFANQPADPVLHLARAGICGVVTRDVDDSPSALGCHLARVLVHSGVDDLLTALRGSFPDDLHGLLRFALMHAHESPTPSAAARAAFCHPKTLRERLRRAGLPTTEKLLMWMRLLRAAQLLRDPGRTIENVTRVMAFGSSGALYKQLRRYADVSPGQLRNPDGVSTLLAAFQRRFQSASGR